MRTRNDTASSVTRFGRTLDRWSWLLRARLPRGIGTAAVRGADVPPASAMALVKGEHVPEFVDAFKSARDGIANQVGFRVTSVAVSGRVH